MPDAPRTSVKRIDVEAGAFAPLRAPACSGFASSPHAHASNIALHATHVSRWRPRYVGFGRERIVSFSLGSSGYRAAMRERIVEARSAERRGVIQGVAPMPESVNALSTRSRAAGAARDEARLRCVDRLAAGFVAHLPSRLDGHVGPRECACEGTKARDRPGGATRRALHEIDLADRFDRAAVEAAAPGAMARELPAARRRERQCRPEPDQCAFQQHPRILARACDWERASLE